MLHNTHKAEPPFCQIFQIIPTRTVQYYGPIFLRELSYRVPQIFLEMVLVILVKPMYSTFVQCCYPLVENPEQREVQHERSTPALPKGEQAPVEEEQQHVGGCQNYGPFLGPIVIRHLIFRGPIRGP